MKALFPDENYGEAAGQDPAGDHDIPLGSGPVLTDECGECAAVAFDGDPLEHDRGCYVLGEARYDYYDEEWERHADARFEELQDRG